MFQARPEAVSAVRVSKRHGAGSDRVQGSPQLQRSCLLGCSRTRAERALSSVCLARPHDATEEFRKPETAAPHRLTLLICDGAGARARCSQILRPCEHFCLAPCKAVHDSAIFAAATSVARKTSFQPGALTRVGRERLEAQSVVWRPRRNAAAPSRYLWQRVVGQSAAPCQTP